MSAKGRPKLGDKARGGVIRFRVSNEEHEVMERAAAHAGKTVSDWGREILLAESAKTK